MVGEIGEPFDHGKFEDEVGISLEELGAKLGIPPGELKGPWAYVLGMQVVRAEDMGMKWSVVSIPQDLALEAVVVEDDIVKDLRLKAEADRELLRRQRLGDTAIGTPSEPPVTENLFPRSLVVGGMWVVSFDSPE